MFGMLRVSVGPVLRYVNSGYHRADSALTPLPCEILLGIQIQVLSATEA